MSMNDTPMSMNADPPSMDAARPSMDAARPSMSIPSAPTGADLPFDLRTPTRHQLPGGVVLHALRGGHGPRLVFIHGAMGDWRSWAPQWDAFCAHFECVAYSRRFSWPNGNTMESPHHSAIDEAADLAALMDALGWQDAMLVGSSYGGFTALALAVAMPQRVRAVVAIEPPMMKYAYRTPQGAAVADAFRRDVIEPANAAFRAGDDARAAAIMTGGIAGANNAANGGETMRRRLQNALAMRRLALSSDEFPLLAPEALAALPMPVMLMSGEDTEPVHAAIFANLCAAMPRARVERVAGAGHGVTREQAATFNALAIGFLQAVVGPPR